jgi:hypothetical protein
MTYFIGFKEYLKDYKMLHESYIYFYNMHVMRLNAGKVFYNTILTLLIMNSRFES